MIHMLRHRQTAAGLGSFLKEKKNYNKRQVILCIPLLSSNTMKSFLKKKAKSRTNNEFILFTSIA